MGHVDVTNPVREPNLLRSSLWHDNTQGAIVLQLAQFSDDNYPYFDYLMLAYQHLQGVK